MLLRVAGAWSAGARTLSEMQNEDVVARENYCTAAFFPNILSFALASLPTPDLTFFLSKPRALPFFVFKLGSLAANFTRFCFTGPLTAEDSGTFFGDLSMETVLVSEGFSVCDLDFLEGCSKSGDGFDSLDFRKAVVLGAEGRPSELPV